MPVAVAESQVPYQVSVTVCAAPVQLATGRAAVAARPLAMPGPELAGRGGPVVKAASGSAAGTGRIRGGGPGGWRPRGDRRTPRAWARSHRLTTRVRGPIRSSAAANPAPVGPT